MGHFLQRNGLTLDIEAKENYRPKNLNAKRVSFEYIDTDGLFDDDTPSTADDRVITLNIESEIPVDGSSAPTSSAETPGQHITINQSDDNPIEKGEDGVQDMKTYANDAFVDEVP